MALPPALKVKVDTDSVGVPVVSYDKQRIRAGASVDLPLSVDDVVSALGCGITIEAEIMHSHDDEKRTCRVE